MSNYTETMKNIMKVVKTALSSKMESTDVTLSSQTLTVKDDSVDIITKASDMDTSGNIYLQTDSGTNAITLKIADLQGINKENFKFLSSTVAKNSTVTPEATNDLIWLSAASNCTVSLANFITEASIPSDTGRVITLGIISTGTTDTDYYVVLSNAGTVHMMGSDTDIIVKGGKVCSVTIAMFNVSGTIHSIVSFANQQS